MRVFITIISFLLVIIACNTTKNEGDQEREFLSRESQSVEVKTGNNLDSLLALNTIELNIESNDFNYPFEKDTSSAGIKYSIKVISPEFFKKLRKFSKEGSFPQEPYSAYASKQDSLLILSYLDGRKDTLFDKRSNESKYTIEGYWEKQKMLLVSYEDWEESDSFFVSFAEQEIFYLAPSFHLSPNNLRFVTFSNVLETPTYESGSLIGLFLSGKITTEISYKNKEWILTEASWLDDYHLILSFSQIDYDNFEAIDQKYAILIIEDEK